MHERDILDLVTSFFWERGKEIVSSDADLFEEGIIDSMELLDLIAAVEEGLGLEMDQELMSVDNFRSLDAIVSTIAKASETPT